MMDQEEHMDTDLPPQHQQDGNEALELSTHPLQQDDGKRHLTGKASEHQVEQIDQEQLLQNPSLLHQQQLVMQKELHRPQVKESHIGDITKPSSSAEQKEVPEYFSPLKRECDLEKVEELSQNKSQQKPLEFNNLQSLNGGLHVEDIDSSIEAKQHHTPVENVFPYFKSQKLNESQQQNAQVIQENNQERKESGKQTEVQEQQKVFQLGDEESKRQATIQNQSELDQLKDKELVEQSTMQEQSNLIQHKEKELGKKATLQEQPEIVQLEGEESQKKISLQEQQFDRKDLEKLTVMEENLGISRPEIEASEKQTERHQHIKGPEDKCLLLGNKTCQDQPKEPQQKSQDPVLLEQQNQKKDSRENKELPNKQRRQNETSQGTKDSVQVKPKQEQQVKKQKTGFVGENYERINYLVQASRTLVNMGESSQEPMSMSFDKPLASQTGSLASAVGRRCLIRLSPSLKSMLCKGCGTALIYGVNSKVRHRHNRQKHLVVTCLLCHTIKRFVMDPKHKLWCEREEAIV